MRFIAGAAVGFIAGLIAAVVFPGPLGLPAVGFVVGLAILASGAWFMWEWRGLPAWLGFAIAVFGTTAWLIYFPPSDDAPWAASAGWTSAWLVASTVAVIVPVPFAARAQARERADS